MAAPIATCKKLTEGVSLTPQTDKTTATWINLLVRSNEPLM